MELIFRLNKTVDVVFGYLTDVEKFVSVHPLIYHMDRTGENTYLVYEKLRLGVIPFAFTYPAQMETLSSEKVVIVRATVFRLTHITMRFELVSDNGSTTVTERIHIKTPLPIKSIMRRVFRSQHNRLFQNIDSIADRNSGNNHL